MVIIWFLILFMYIVFNSEIGIFYLKPRLEWVNFFMTNLSNLTRVTSGDLLTSGMFHCVGWLAPFRRIILETKALSQEYFHDLDRRFRFYLWWSSPCELNLWVCICTVIFLWCRRVQAPNFWSRLAYMRCEKRRRRCKQCVFVEPLDIEHSKSV